MLKLNAKEVLIVMPLLDFLPNYHKESWKEVFDMAFWSCKSGI